MSDWQITEQQLSEINYLLQKSDELVVWMNTTRTAQESKLFPVIPYMWMSFFDSYYRYPDLIRLANQHITPEKAGARAREATTKLTSWCTYNFYLYGRLFLLNMGLIKPEDNLEDLWLMTDWYKRFQLGYHRQNPHITIKDASDQAPELPERTLQVLEADAFAVTPGSDLESAVRRFFPTLTQYTFLAHCECRIGIHASGPYRIGENLTMVTQDWMDLSQNDFPWLDEVGEGVSFNNLTMPVILRDTKSEVTDWGSHYAQPEYWMPNVVGVGLYTSDFLTDRYQPVGMGSEQELTDTLNRLTEEITDATAKLYRRFAGMSWDQMVDAGNFVYTHSLADYLHMAGIYDPAHWEFVDARTERFRDFLNEEYCRTDYGECFFTNDGRAQQRNEYYRHPVVGSQGSNQPLVPSSVLNDHDYSRRVNPNGLADLGGTFALDKKSAPYSYAAGKLSLEEANAKAVEVSNSPVFTKPWVNLDDSWVMHHWDTPEANKTLGYSPARAPGSSETTSDRSAPPRASRLGKRSRRRSARRSNPPSATTVAGLRPIHGAADLVPRPASGDTPLVPERDTPGRSRG
jgi:hypothetical protein